MLALVGSVFPLLLLSSSSSHPLWQTMTHYRGKTVTRPWSRSPFHSTCRRWEMTMFAEMVRRKNGGQIQETSVKFEGVCRISFLEAGQISSSFSSLRSVITWLLVPATAVSGGIAHQFQTSTCTEGAEQIWMSVTSACIRHGWRWQEWISIKGTESNSRERERIQQSLIHDIYLALSHQSNVHYWFSRHWYEKMSFKNLEGK